MIDYLHEAGVNYIRFVECDRPLPKNYNIFAYQWHHVPSGKHGSERVAIFGGPTGARADFLKLLQHWNGRADWIYSPESTEIAVC